uniref:EF-hand domain-containing protein n=1 Tax=Haptolina brevifila TaxID=156173 RepID=A0A7S2JB14_9EUKA|mmetsp:Transcript_78879/g.156821  ORF Transcript_78879/g.156821 Transcript_78879/m.156821 type:complete len:389 (+) Transcript_78879:35-1201(+)
MRAPSPCASTERAGNHADVGHVPSVSTPDLIQAADDDASFEARLAEAIIKQGEAKGIAKGGKVVDALLRDWDKSGDGDISKGEFRLAVRSSLKVRATDDEINTFFDHFDEDGGGSLTLDELKPALLALQNARKNKSDEAVMRDQLVKDILGVHEDCAAALSAAAVATSQWEASSARIIDFQQALSFESRVGLGLVNSNQPLDKLIREWPNAPAGYATLEAVQQGIDGLNVQAYGGYKPTELEQFYKKAFFAGLDTSMCRPGGGIQLKHELKALRKLGMAAVKQQRQMYEANDTLLQEAKRLQAASLLAEDERNRKVQASNQAFQVHKVEATTTRPAETKNSKSPSKGKATSRTKARSKSKTLLAAGEKGGDESGKKASEKTKKNSKGV